MLSLHMDLKHELALVKQAQAGNKEALGELWDAITPKLFGYLVNTLRDTTLAEDILQSTWLKAIKALPGFKPQGISISAWLFAIARNECKQHWRKGQREVGFEEGLHDKAATNNQTESNILIEQMLNKLSPEDQELIRLRYISDLPINEIAKILNINFVAARVRLHRAIAKARAAMDS
jgi:RNA polymerase sigma-70 factor (ECF subfamily)